MKFLKINLIGILILIGIIAIFLIISTINHNRQLKNEVKEKYPSGSMVVVNNKQLHVFSGGEGSPTLVFLAGHGTNNPVLDFKPLWMRMQDDFSIAVVERSGYGWSEASDSPRDIDTILQETREALKRAGASGPYVLVPHSMAGLEALYWAQEYPNEVQAIIGLDPAVPGTYDILPDGNKIQLYLMRFISKTGVSRFMEPAQLENLFPVLKSDDLTESEKEKYIAAFYKNAFSSDVLREVDFLQKNAEIVAENSAPAETPMYFFISTGQEEIVADWTSVLMNYLSQITESEYMRLDSGHYVHYEKSKIIADEAKRFLEDLGF